MQRDWYKRRQPNKSNLVVSVKLENFKKIHQHPCVLIVTYQDGTIKNLISRVLYSSFKNRWAIDGMHESVIIHDD